MKKFLYAQGRSNGPQYVISTEAIRWARANDSGVEITLHDGERIITDTFDIPGLCMALGADNDD